MTEFDIIINATEQYVEAAEMTSEKDVNFIRKLTDIILNQEVEKTPYKLSRKVSFKDSIKYVDEFLKTINESYSEYFHMRLNDGTFIFEEDIEGIKQAYSDYDSVNNKRILYIPLSYNIIDSFLIVHELFHDINLDENENSIARVIFTEGLSFLAELLYEKYLVENKIKDAKIVIKYDFYSLRKRAFEVDYNIKLIEKYLMDGYLNVSSIIEIFEGYSTDDIKDIINANRNIILNKELTILVQQTYIYGFLIATYLYKHIEDNKKNINEVFELNEMLKYYTIEQVLDYLNIPYSDFELDEKAYKEVADNYKYMVKRR